MNNTIPIDFEKLEEDIIQSFSSVFEQLDKNMFFSEISKKCEQFDMTLDPTGEDDQQLMISKLEGIKSTLNLLVNGSFKYMRKDENNNVVTSLLAKNKLQNRPTMRSKFSKNLKKI